MFASGVLAVVSFCGISSHIVPLCESFKQRRKMFTYFVFLKDPVGLEAFSHIYTCLYKRVGGGDDFIN